jgi:hypothetical protein
VCIANGSRGQPRVGMSNVTKGETLLKECAAAFPGMKATLDQLEEWRKHPGYHARHDPFLNSAKPAEMKDEEFEPVRTPEFELSRKLDETMRDVYKHLHDALTDQTFNGQELKLGRAYTAVTQFQMEHSSALSQIQTASIACTRDQVAKLQCDLAERTTRLNVSVDQLEASFQRMNSWRSEDDPLKTMTLAQYIDKQKREEHAVHVTKEDRARVHVDAAEMIADIELLARDKGGFAGKGLWFGINNNVLCPSGQRLPGGTLMACKTEEEWTKLLSTLPMMKCKCEMLKMPGTESYVSELTDVRHDGKRLTVIYWGIALEDNNGEGSGDPRANLVCHTLSGHRFVWPYVAIWAQIRQVNRSEPDGERKTVGEPHEEHDAPKPPRSPSPAPRRRSPATMSIGDDDGESIDSGPRWSESICSGSVETLRHEANKLMERAKAIADLGDHKTAYELMAQGYSLRQEADQCELDITAAPVADEPKVYKPEVRYEYPSGEVRIIEAGYYTESEHLKRSMEEQEVLSAVKTATAAGVAAAKLTPTQMSKYETPLVRTESQAEAMTAAELLAPAVADMAIRARDVMQSSRDASKQASPKESPKMSGSPSQALPKDAISFKLPNDLMGASERELAQSLPLPKSLQPGSALFAPSREDLLQEVPLGTVWGAVPDAPDCSEA